MKVGDYVRNKYGIAKVIDIENKNGIDILVFDKPICFLVNKETGEIKDDRLLNKLAIIDGIDIKKLKSSTNIIDLIEVGDIIHYHNEYIDFISPVIIYDDGEIASNLYDSDGYIFLDKEKDKNNIKSIVTKEQFEAMEYKCE